MKKITYNREILILHKSSFFKREWCELNKSPHLKKFSQTERLIELCWNGMLREIVPEIFEAEAGKKSLILCGIYESENLLDLIYGNIKQELNDEWSINPYVYLNLAILN
jgi:hypothetical protein